MKRKHVEVAPSPKIARVQESGDVGSVRNGNVSEVTSALLNAAGDSSQSPESNGSSTCSSPVLSGNSTESSQADDPSSESSSSGNRVHTSTECSGAARTIAITQLPVVLGKFTSLVGRNSPVTLVGRNSPAALVNRNSPIAVVSRNSPVVPVGRHLSGDRHAQSISVINSSGDHSCQSLGSSASFESLMPAHGKSPNPVSNSDDVKPSLVTNHGISSLRFNMSGIMQEPVASTSGSRDRHMSYSSMRRHILNGVSASESDQNRLSPVFRFGQSSGKHSQASSPVNLAVPYFGQSLQNVHTSVSATSLPAYSMAQPVNSMSRLNGHINRSSVPHHSVYETSTGSLFRSTMTVSTSQAAPTCASPDSSRVPLSRPDGVCLLPRRKSHSESTVSRYVGIEGSSARSRGLTAFSDLRSGYQPLSNQIPQSSLPLVITSSASSSTGSPVPECPVNSSVPRHLDTPSSLSSIHEAAARQQQQHPQLADVVMSRMRHMYHSWTNTVVASGDSHDATLGLHPASLNNLSEASESVSGRRVLSTRGLLQDSGLPSWWQNTLEQVESRDISPDTPKPFPSTGDETCHEDVELPSSVHKNYASLIKKAGPYILGPRIGSSPVHSIVQCLARREKTNKYYILKILTLPDVTKETTDDRQGKMLMLTEFSLLSQLKDMKGVVHCRDFFKDKAWDPKQKCEVNRLCLLVDCLMPHDYDQESHYLVNLQHHVIHEKKLGEKEALIIFWDIARIVEQLHKRNIVHRDLKLGNMIVDRRSWRVTITNFCLGKHLSSDKDKLRDQRGSPAYISPDVLSGKPYYGKPSDMWALGVVLFTMLYGQFPFYDCMPQELFRKIKTAEFTIPNDGRVGEDTKQLIHQLLTLDAQTRMTAGQVVDALESIIGKWKGMMACETDQVVPDIPMKLNTEFQEEENDKATQTDQQCSPVEIPVVPSRQVQPAATSSASNRQLMIKLTSDARPISPAEIRVIRHLFTSRR